MPGDLRREVRRLETPGCRALRSQGVRGASFGLERRWFDKDKHRQDGDETLHFMVIAYEEMS